MRVQYEGGKLSMSKFTLEVNSFPSPFFAFVFIFEFLYLSRISIWVFFLFDFFIHVISF
jgi:hypothetical protein